MKKLIALSCLTAVLLAGCGDYGSGKKSEKEKEATTAAATTTAQQTTEEVTTEAETTTEPVSKPKTGDRTTMYHGVYMDKIKELYGELAEENNGKVRIDYAVYDVDEDGVPELLLKYADSSEDSWIDIFTCDENTELKNIGDFAGGDPSFGSAADAGKMILIFEEEDYISALYCVLSDVRDPGNPRVLIDDSDAIDTDENSDVKALLAEKGIRYLSYVSINGSGDDIKSVIIDPNTDSTEEKDGLYLDYLG